MFASLSLALTAGVLSVLSPCVLPLLPIVLATAASEHRLGPAALAMGLALSFMTIGLFVATVGFSIGLESGTFRFAAAVLLIMIGIVLMVPRLQTQIAAAAGPVGNWTEQRFGGFSFSGLPGQFGLGFLLGAGWTPCVGPTLGAASILAAQGQDLGQVAVTMLLFGIGAGLPLLALGLLSRETMTHWRRRLLAGGKGMKIILGLVLSTAGMLVLGGFDKRIEAILVDASPVWLTNLTTRF